METSKVMVNTTLPMLTRSMRVSSAWVTSKAAVPRFGMMEEGTRVTSRMERKTERAPLYGLMAQSTSVPGETINNTALVSTVKGTPSAMVSGSTVSASVGSKLNLPNFDI